MKEEQFKETLKDLQHRLNLIHNGFKNFFNEKKEKNNISMEGLRRLIDEHNEYKDLLNAFHVELKKSKDIYSKYKETLVLIEALVAESVKFIDEIEVNYTLIDPNYNKYHC